MQTDLRSTLGWKLTSHARSSAADRGFGIADVLLAAADPEIRYTAYDYGEGREVHQRGDVAVVVHQQDMTIITVLWRQQSQWTDGQARARRRPATTPSLVPLLTSLV